MTPDHTIVASHLDEPGLLLGTHIQMGLEEPPQQLEAFDPQPVLQFAMGYGQCFRRAKPTDHSPELLGGLFELPARSGLRVLWNHQGLLGTYPI
jgi:hypothetical protein